MSPDSQRLDWNSNIILSIAIGHLVNTNKSPCNLLELTTWRPHRHEKRPLEANDSPIST